MTSVQRRTLASRTVTDFIAAYARQHPDEQPDIIDWLASTLVQWVDPRALWTFSQELPGAAQTGKLPGLQPCIY